LNSFEENGIKHVRSAILQIKTIGKIDQNACILRYMAKMQEIMLSWKKSAISPEKQHFSDIFQKLRKQHYIATYFFKSLKTHEVESKMPIYSNKTAICD